MPWCHPRRGQGSLTWRCSPWLPLCPTQHDPGEAARVLQDSLFQGGGAEGAETHSPARRTMTHAAFAMFVPLLPCRPLAHISANPWRERGCGKGGGGCGKRQREAAREHGPEEMAAIKAYTWKSPGATALGKLLGSFIFRVEMPTLRGMQPPSLAVPQVTGCPWDSLEQRL